MDHVVSVESLWGHRARVGFIDLSTSIVMSAELAPALPDGVGALMTRIRLPNAEVSAAALMQMVESDRLEEATRELADGGAQAIAFGCTTGSLVGGPGFDQRLMKRMAAAADVPVTTTSTAVLEALRAVGAQRVAVATPYVDELNALEGRFLEAAGFEIAALEGLQIDTDPEIARVPYTRTRDLAHAVAGDADTVFISCMNLPTLAILERLEHELERPVISSVAVTIWHALQLAGVACERSGFGSLLAGRYDHGHSRSEVAGNTRTS